MKEILEYLKRDLGVSDEEYRQAVEAEKERIKNPTYDYSGLDIDAAKNLKLKELYNEYQKEKWSEITSSLLGDDGEPIVFGYLNSNRQDYMAIANKFALDPNVTESIIGSKSHGKFIISREDFITFTRDCDNHEITLYQKLKAKQTEVENASDVETVKAIVWG